MRAQKSKPATFWCPACLIGMSEDKPSYPTRNVVQELEPTAEDQRINNANFILQLFFSAFFNGMGTAAGTPVAAAVGGAMSAGASSIINTALRPKVGERQTRLLVEVYEGLCALQAKVDNLRLEDLTDNDAFVSTLMEGVSIAAKTHQEEKLKAIRNAVLNAAVGKTPQEDLRAKFMEFVDSMTDAHIDVLTFCNNPMLWIQQNSKHIRYGGPFAERVLPDNRTIPLAKYVNTGEEQAIYQYVIDDLYRWGLVEYGLRNGDYKRLDGSGKPQGMCLLTPIGRQFFDFISTPENDGSSGKAE